MIDIHAHILPAADDGSKDLSQSLEMLFEEERQGVTDIVLTPHYRADYLTDKDELTAKFEELKKAAAENGVKSRLYLGQEIFVFDGIVDLLKQGKVLPINGTNYVLIEFSAVKYADIPETVYTLSTKGYLPIVAHLERYAYADLDVAREVKETGGLIQVNAGSFCGKLKRLYKRKVRELIKDGLVDFVASDVHYSRKSSEKA